MSTDPDDRLVAIIPKILRNLLFSGLKSPQDFEVLRKILLLNLIMFLGILFLLVLGVLAVFQRNITLALADATLLVVLVFLILQLRRMKNINRVALAGIILNGLFFCFLIAMGGVDMSAFVWVLTYPLISLFLLGSRKGAVASLLMLLASIFMFLGGQVFSFMSLYPGSLIIRSVFAYLCIFLLAYIWETNRELVHKSLIESYKVLSDTNRFNENLIEEQKKAIEEIELLRGILPICANCKKVRNDSGYWEQVEEYFGSRSRAQFSHSICPDCVKHLYGDYLQKKRS